MGFRIHYFTERFFDGWVSILHKGSHDTGWFTVVFITKQNYRIRSQTQNYLFTQFSISFKSIFTTTTVYAIYSVITSICVMKYEGGNKKEQYCTTIHDNIIATGFKKQYGRTLFFKPLRCRILRDNLHHKITGCEQAI